MGPDMQLHIFDINMHPLIIIIIAIIITIIIIITTFIIMPQGKPLNIIVFEKGLNRNFSRWLAVLPANNQMGPSQDGCSIHF